jgi:acyl carrier protein
MDMTTDVRSVIVEIIAAELQVPAERVRSGVSLRKDLKMDSVAALNIVFGAEEALGIHIPETELENVDDLDAVLALVTAHAEDAPERAGH